ncbi:sensor histidine kinase [Maribellus sp. CM-23]|uniref:sensor histidine kinase n=1 Tax=Maribellus sp. CM-23 TaxID=2781026 RepID=UPI001F2EBF87|nr:histidine kinase [Maribellus sp. CM-23]MCE4566813.1 sensor histidine kinase [Maribellus sp. CM-23]
MKYTHQNKKEKPDLALRLPSYAAPSVIIRFTVISLIATVILHFIVYVVDGPSGVNLRIPAVIYVAVIIPFNLAVELQIILDNILERFLPVPTKMKLRFILQISVGFLFLILAHRVIMYFIEPELGGENSRPGVILGMAAGLIFIQMVANSLTLARISIKWLNSQEIIAKMKREKLEMDYNSLQDQLNPHFLFNNLSVLKSLIIYDPEVAVYFTENFTDVYRYVLQSKNKKLVKLKDELEFMKAYFALHKERLGEGLMLEHNNISVEELDREIAPLTGQLLIENAIKHNITSKETPLEITVFAKDGYLSVSNNLNLRTTSYSTKTGLGNLIGRYKMLTEKQIEVHRDEKKFEVKVPLL